MAEKLLRARVSALPNRGVGHFFAKTEDGRTIFVPCYALARAAGNTWHAFAPPVGVEIEIELFHPRERPGVFPVARTCRIV